MDSAEEPPGSRPPDSYLSRDALIEYAARTRDALKKRTTRSVLNGEMIYVRALCGDLESRFVDTSKGPRPVNTRLLERLVRVTSEMYGDPQGKATFPRDLLRLARGLRQINSMTPETASKYERALSFFEKESTIK